MMVNGDDDVCLSVCLSTLLWRWVQKYTFVLNFRVCFKAAFRIAGRLDGQVWFKYRVYPSEVPALVFSSSRTAEWHVDMILNEN